MFGTILTGVAAVFASALSLVFCTFNCCLCIGDCIDSSRDDVAARVSLTGAYSPAIEYEERDS